MWLCLVGSTPRILFNIHDHFDEFRERPLDEGTQEAAQEDQQSETNTVGVLGAQPCKQNHTDGDDHLNDDECLRW